MTDFVTPKQRSTMMATIKGKNTKPEMVVRRFLHRRGFRFRLHVKSLPGSPDIVLPRRRAVVFVNGCFWHQHQGCRRAFVPKSNTDFWGPKLRANQARDAQVHSELEQLGWRVFVVWECEATAVSRLEHLAEELGDASKHSR